MPTFDINSTIRDKIKNYAKEDLKNFASDLDLSSESEFVFERKPQRKQ